MEVIFGAPIHLTRSNSAVTITAEYKEKLTEPSHVELKKMESKKRGVYVEKWASPKQIRIEDNKRQPRMKPKPKPRQISEKLLTTAPAESKIATFTRLLGTADPAVRFKKRKTPKTTTTPPKISKQNSKMSNITANSKPKSDIKPLRNIIEENKKMKKFRSHTLREVYSKMSEKTIAYKPRREIVQTPSNCSKVTRDISDHAHWSNIFPSDRQNAGKNLLQKYICNYEQGGNTLNDEINTDKNLNTTLGNGKQEPVCDFFIDLLESVYDEELLNADDVANDSPKTSDVKFEIDANVAQKLYRLQSSSNRYMIKDEIYDTSNQNQQLADYYNSRKRLIPQKRRRRRKTIKSFPYMPPYGKVEERKKPRKPNLLSILKEQLSIDYAQDEPGNMYEALLTIAKQKRKRRQVHIDASSREPSEPDGVCRFKRRNVISPSTRLQNKNALTKGYSMNVARENYRSDTTTNERDSSHSIEVIGYDYDEGLNLDSMLSESETVLKNARKIPILNEGLTTVTQYWND